MVVTALKEFCPSGVAVMNTNGRHSRVLTFGSIFCLRSLLCLELHRTSQIVDPEDSCPDNRSFLIVVRSSLNSTVFRNRFQTAEDNHDS